MKKLLLIFLLAIVFSSCSPKKELSKDEAARIIKENMKYPLVIDYDIYCSDPESARKIIDGGVEQAWLVTVQHTQKLSDAGRSLVEFTDKAKPYLLPTPEKDREVHVQKVKLAEEDLADVTNIKIMDDGKKAIAEYTTVYKNVSGFSGLTDINLNQSHTRTANLALYDDGLKLEKK